jgi:hypothetical protein
MGRAMQVDDTGWPPLVASVARSSAVLFVGSAAVADAAVLVVGCYGKVNMLVGLTVLIALMVTTSVEIMEESIQKKTRNMKKRRRRKRRKEWVLLLTT